MGTHGSTKKPIPRPSNIRSPETVRVHNRQESPTVFPVVGIGASAGGIEACKELLKQLPGNLPMAVIVAQHVASNHASTLPQTLATATEWPVKEAKHGERLAPGHIYVNPAAADVVVRNATLELVQRKAQPARRMPIDMLFQSLASDLKARAAGVVLSGAAYDGTQGLRAIRLEGGLTFAQDPRSAQHDSMPRHAIDAGVADFVLTPAQIAAELASLARDYPRRVMPDRAARAWKAEDMSRIVSLLRNATGLDFSLYKETTVQRRIQRRMAVHRLRKLPEYAKYIEDHPGEAKVLRDELFIHVTGFFRDGEAFKALREHVFPDLLKARNKDNPSPLRIWVPGCATGEEVYSLAFSLLDFIGEERPDLSVQIFGSDIAEKAIERARKAIYSEDAVSDIDPKWVNRFFVRTERGYQVSKPIRDRCVFVVHDMSSDPPFSKIDLISCRNVLIYFKQELQNRVIPTLHYALNVPGFLLLGRTEALTGFGSLFTAVDRTNRIYCKKQASNRLVLRGNGRLASLDAPEPRAQALHATPKEVDVRREIDQMLLSRYAPASVLVTADFEILQFRGRTGAYLEPPTGQANLNLFKMAREGLLGDLRQALEQAKRDRRAVRKEGLRMRTDGHTRTVNLEVVPVQGPGTAAADQRLLVLFEDEELSRVRSKGQPATKSKRARRGGPIEELRAELSSTRDYLQSVVEQQAAMNDELTSTNEELLASNEELQSTNEELETAKEELQSSNEELSTVNDELQARNQELTHLNDDLLNLFASVEVPIIMLDREQKIRRFTPKANDLMRVIPTDIGRAFADIKLRIELPDLESWIAEVMARLEPKEVETRDGGGRWFRLRIRPYLTSSGTFDGVVISLVDIDSLKRALDDASRARDYVSSIVQTVPVPLLILDRELRVRSANRLFYDTFKLEPRATETVPLPELGAREWDEEELVRALQGVIEDGAILDGLEIERDFRAIGQRSFLIGARRLPAPAEEPLAVLTIQDITDRKLLEAERARLRNQASQEFLDSAIAVLLPESMDCRAMLEKLAHVAITRLGDWCIIDLVEGDGTIHQAAAAHGDADKERIARELARKFPAQKALPHGVAHVIATGEPEIHPEVTDLAWFAEMLGAEHPDFLRALGARSYLCVPLRGRGRTIGALSLVRALPPRRYDSADLELAVELGQRAGMAVENVRLYEAAQEAVRARDEFMAIASHELRTPIATLKLLLQGLGGQIRNLEPAGKELAPKVDRALKQTDRLTNLIESLIDVSRITAERLALNLVETDLSEIVREVATRFREQAMSVQSPLEVSASEPIVGYWDRLRLEQIVANLLSNALRYAPGKPIELRVETTPKTAKLIVRDHGPGISRDQWDRIFHRFERAAGTKPFAGLGLGLYITRQIAEAHGGRISVDSQDGAGSTFVVELPFDPRVTNGTATSSEVMS